MKSFSLFFLAVMFSCNVIAASRAKYAGEFIAIGVGGRALGLGGAYTALANDGTSGYWNPAGLSRLNYPQLILMHDEGFGGLINYDYGAAALPLGPNTSLAFSAIRLGVDDIANTKNAWTDFNHDGRIQENELDRNNITYFNSADWAFYISYARKLDDRFSYGANLKLIRRDQGEGSATGIGFDLAAQYLLSDKFLLGANLQDATTTLIAWSTGTNELISPTLKIGSAYLIDALGGQFAPAFDVDVRFENRQSASNAHLGSVSFDFHSGLEFNFRNLVAVRAGMSELGTLNLGTGIHLPKFDIDYSFAKFDAIDQLDNSHRISLTFTLQADQFVRNSQ
ncbi:MAG TPA: PorV/PorQ family protein [Bacteroidota bacterium]|nr:PorV/PorQ family protein [Bacteroidota bacterium]